MGEIVTGKRLMCDGNGKLFAHPPDDPEDLVEVKFHDGSYVTVDEGEPSHNQTHHQQFAMIDGTRDEEQVLKALDDAGEFDEGIRQAYLNARVNVGGGENMHHYEVQEDDPHYDEEAPNKTRLKSHPDSLSQVLTGQIGRASCRERV